MHLAKKILLVHPDSRTRRRCVMLLAASGFDIRSCGDAASACHLVQEEWFDLAVLDHHLPDAPEFDLTERLRKIQPTLALMMLVEQLEFPIVVQGIRQGLSDVIPPSEDLAPIVARVCAYFEVVPSLDAEDLTQELQEAERVLSCLGGEGPAGQHWERGANSQTEALLTAARERTVLERHLERLAHERNALEVQLKTLLAQNHDLICLQKESATLRSQKEIISASQAAIDLKARQLASQRAEIQREKKELVRERREAQEREPGPSVVAQGSFEQEHRKLMDWQTRLAEQAEKLAAETTRVHQDRSQLASERQNWHRDLETLREQEANLRRYEARLREAQAALETDRVGLLGVRPSASPTLPAQEEAPSEAVLRDSWAKYRRATEIIETEKAHVREDKLALRDWEKALKEREFVLQQRELKFRQLDQQLRTQVPSKTEPSPAASSSPSSSSVAETVLSLTRAPFEVARSVLGRKR